MRTHTISIVAGLAVGAFIGYEFATSLIGYPPYSWISQYYVNKIQAGLTAATPV